MRNAVRLEADPVTKRILENPEKCRSILLDVTVLKPQGNQTSLLRPVQVRQLLATLEKQKRRKARLMQTLHDTSSDTIVKVRRHPERIYPTAPVDDLRRYRQFGGNVEPLFCEIKKSLKNVETKIANMQDINLMISQTTVEASTSEEYFYSNKRKCASFPTSRYNFDPCETTYPANIKPECTCQKCRMLAHLHESQKHPLITELRESPSPDSMMNFMRRVRLKKPEVVPCTYDFDGKNLGYLYQLAKRVKVLEERLAIQEERAISKDYFRRIIRKIVGRVQHQKPQLSRDTFDYFQMMTPTTPTFRPEKKPDEGNMWKWGEEVLRPGIDLKNRIVVLFTEILSKFALVPKNQVDGGGEKKQREKNKYTTMILSDRTTPRRKRTSPVSSAASSTKNINVAYLNPKLNKKPMRKAPTPVLRTPRRASNVSSQVVVDCQLMQQILKYAVTSVGNPLKKYCKQEFIKIVAKARAAQKEALWNNIWNQAKANGQSKSDTITVKIPANNGKVNEIELTIKEVEEVLKGTRRIAN